MLKASLLEQSEGKEHSALISQPPWTFRTVFDASELSSKEQSWKPKRTMTSITYAQLICLFYRVLIIKVIYAYDKLNSKQHY